MQKVFKYIIVGVIAVLIFGSGFITGCAYSRGTTKGLERENAELQGSIRSYSATIESLNSDRIRIAGRVSDLESEIVELGTETPEIIDISESIETGLGSLSGRISDSRQGIQKVADGLGELNSELQFYIERAENP
ncbi:MAG: hypothetical protein E3J23_08430 [Candidatus Stahlbacteria bacterium]|nr:MAG: hypothetical protein E3J23_08430 [Candidatus Stahlbacteria bacterium]